MRGDWGNLHPWTTFAALILISWGGTGAAEIPIHGPCTAQPYMITRVRCRVMMKAGALTLRGGCGDDTSADGRKPNVLLALTGSVATIKAVELVQGLLAFANVQVLSTSKAALFFDRKLLEELGVRVWTDEDEWGLWKVKGDPVQHIELRRWADVLVFAPLSANTLAKLANGLCDNLATCVARAWPIVIPGQRLRLTPGPHEQEAMLKRMAVAPAMNTAMWRHPVTSAQVNTLASWGIDVLYPVSKELVCGDTGVGAMASVDDICNRVKGLCQQISMYQEMPNSDPTSGKKRIIKIS